MAIPIASNFDLKSQLPIDQRLLFDTLADMKAYDPMFLPDMYFCQVKETGKFYTFNRTNPTDPTLGKWVEFKAGTSEGYKHEQTTPAATWSITHSLNNAYPDVRCYDSTGDEIFGDVSFVSANMITVTFCVPLAGTCYVR